MAEVKEVRYVTRNMVGDLPTGSVFGEGKFDADLTERLLGLGSIEVYDPPTPVAVTEEKEESPELAKALKESKAHKKRADEAEASLKEAEATIAKVKAHVDSLPDDQKKAFQTAVNPVEEKKAK